MHLLLYPYDYIAHKQHRGSGSFKSCDSLLKRVEENDAKLVELVVLPMKTFGAAECDRLSAAIGE
jgi:hypothetical protein